jgi:hypothetical protein
LILENLAKIGYDKNHQEIYDLFLSLGEGKFNYVNGQVKINILLILIMREDSFPEKEDIYLGDSNDYKPNFISGNENINNA